MPVVGRDGRHLRIAQVEDSIGTQVGKFALEDLDLVNSALRCLACSNPRCVITDICDFNVPRAYITISKPVYYPLGFRIRRL
jgi:hypothetical protein